MVKITNETPKQTDLSNNIIKNSKDIKTLKVGGQTEMPAFKSDSNPSFEFQPLPKDNQLSRMRSNSFQRSPSASKSSDNSAKQQQQQQSIEPKYKMVVIKQQNENSENIKPPIPKLFQQHTFNTHSNSSSQIKKTKVDSTTNTEPFTKTLINVTYNNPAQNQTVSTSNVTQLQVSKNSQQSMSYNNILTENNSQKVIETNSK